MPEESHVQIVADANAIGYMTVFSLALITYEYFLTIQEEVDMIWSSPWNVPKITYLWNRYFTFLTLGLNASIRLREMKTDQICTVYLHILGGNATLMVCTVDFILMLRVWVLYGRPRLLLNIILPAILVEIATMTYIEATTVESLPPYVHLGPKLPGCNIQRRPGIFGSYSIPPLIITTTMFCLTIYKCGRALRAYRPSMMPIITLFLRDGVFWFLAVFAVGLPHLLISYIARPALSEVMIGPSLAIYSIIASRTLMNIKKIMRDTSRNETTYASIEFELPDRRTHQESRLNAS